MRDAEDDLPLPYVDHVGLVAWTAEHADVDEAVASAVLEVEFEYMVAVGIVQDASGYEFRYYDPAELVSAPQEVDTLRIARDAQRLAHVPEALAHRVLEAELQFLEMRGIA
jgi:hypothetical protein